MHLSFGFDRMGESPSERPGTPAADAVVLVVFRQIQLPAAADVVAVVAQPLVIGRRRERQVVVVRQRADAMRQKSRGEGYAGGCAYRRGCHALGEPHSALCDAVDGRRVDPIGAGASEPVVP